VRSAAAVLAALVVGLLAGAWVGASGSAALVGVADHVGAAGTLWINAIRMTVIPLVAALTVTSVAGTADVARVGRVGGYALLVFVVLLVAGGVFTMLIAPIALDRLVVPADAAATLRESLGSAAAAAQPAQIPTVVQRIIDMVPVNPVRAAADGAVLPVVVFSLAFGLALSRIEAGRRDAVVQACRTVADAMLIVVGWVLRAAPVGVFALALVLGVRMGVGSAAAILHYVVTLSACLLAFTLMLYPVAVVFGRVSPRLFAAAALPAQAVAFSVRSSLAALPAMVAGARDTLRLPAMSSGFVLPLAVSVFRVNVPIAWVVGVLFLARLYGVEITTAQLAMLVVTSTLISFSVPGIPSASLFLLSPVLVQHGIPAEGVGILIAVDAIPDMFKTLVNVTAHMTSAVVVSRYAPQGEDGVNAAGAPPT
jgi:proton glutamate symport protein